jgi:uncharacterized cupin superfamily protein
MWQGPKGGRGVLVAGTEAPDVVELWHWTLEPGEARHSPAHARGTQELVHLLEGRVALQIGVETVDLDTGDSVSFRSDAEHSYANRDQDRPARYSMAVIEPGVGSNTEE